MDLNADERPQASRARLVPDGMHRDWHTILVMLRAKVLETDRSRKYCIGRLEALAIH